MYDGPAMSGETRFNPGDAVVLRDIFRGRIKAAIPLRVVEDSPDRFVGWLPAGSRFFIPADAQGNLVKDVFGFDHLIELSWAMPASPGQLVVVPSGALYSVLVRFYDPGWQVPEWYVNLQRSLARTEIGFDATDLIIDMVVSTTTGEWRWKDELEFAEAVEKGFMSAMEADDVRAAGESALELAFNGGPPFDAEWLGWRPPSDWAAPELPQGWAELPTTA